MESPLLVKTGETDDTYNFNLEEGTKLFATNNEEENDFQGLSFDGESFSGDSDWFMKTLYNAEVGTGAMDVAALIDLEKTIDDYESSPLPFCHEEKPNTKEDQEEPNYTTFEDQEKESARSVLMGLIPTILHASIQQQVAINNNNNNNKLEKPTLVNTRHSQKITVEEKMIIHNPEDKSKEPINKIKPHQWTQFWELLMTVPEFAQLQTSSPPGSPLSTPVTPAPPALSRLISSAA